MIFINISHLCVSGSNIYLSSRAQGGPACIPVLPMRMLAAAVGKSVNIWMASRLAPIDLAATRIKTLTPQAKAPTNWIAVSIGLRAGSREGKFLETTQLPRDNGMEAKTFSLSPKVILLKTAGCVFRRRLGR
jgi:hypothetical protein